MCQAQLGAVAEPLSGQLQHLGAGVDTGDDRASLAQRREEGAGAAADVQDPPPSHVAGQVQDWRPRVVAVDEVGFRLGRVRLGDAVVLARMDSRLFRASGVVTCLRAARSLRLWAAVR